MGRQVDILIGGCLVGRRNGQLGRVDGWDAWMNSCVDK